MTNSFISPALIAAEANIAVRKSKKTMAVAIALLVIGIACVAGMMVLPVETAGFVSISLGLLSATCILIGIVQLAFGGKAYIYTPTNSKIYGRTFFCTSGKGQETITAIKSKNWAQLEKLISQNESGVKLEFVTSKDRQFARCQVLTFIPYNFEPLSDILILSSEEIEELLKVTGTKI